MKNKKKSLSEKLWNLWCIISIIGLWPRFIEPKWIRTTSLKISLPNLPPDLKNLKILQLSDIHFHPNIPEHFYSKLSRKVAALKPDLIVFTGDLLCHARLEDHSRLKRILSSFYAPYGCYAILGNHDYSQSISINSKGDYDVVGKPRSSILEGFKRLLRPLKLTKVITENAKNVGLHNGLITLFKGTPFELLHNESRTITIKNSKLNICGLGEHMLDRCQPEIAFKQYEEGHPGIVLVHNPDSVAKLKNYPGDIILCGHTHGGQVNLPWMWKSFTLLEDMRFKRGLHQADGKWVYVNRGIGSTMQFRWFSPPEILLLTLDEA